MIGLLMQKICMTTIYYKGKQMSATILKTQSPKILNIKKIENGKSQITIGFFNLEKKEERKYNKAYLNGSYQSEGSRRKIIKTFTINEQLSLKFKNQIEIIEKKLISEDGNIKVSDLFSQDMLIEAYGNSKGCGFSGGIKRWNFDGLRATHGVSVAHRAIGSTGCRKPNRVIKGRKMPGRFGNDNIYVGNLKILNINDSLSTLVVSGSVPGKPGSFVKLLISNKNKLI